MRTLVRCMCSLLTRVFTLQNAIIQSRSWNRFLFQWSMIRLSKIGVALGTYKFVNGGSWFVHASPHAPFSVSLSFTNWIFGIFLHYDQCTFVVRVNPSNTMIYIAFSHGETIEVNIQNKTIPSKALCIFVKFGAGWKISPQYCTPNPMQNMLFHQRLRTVA